MFANCILQETSFPTKTSNSPKNLYSEIFSAIAQKPNKQSFIPRHRRDPNFVSQNCFLGMPRPIFHITLIRVRFFFSSASERALSKTRVGIPKCDIDNNIRGTEHQKGSLIEFLAKARKDTRIRRKNEAGVEGEKANLKILINHRLHSESLRRESNSSWNPWDAGGRGALFFPRGNHPSLCVLSSAYRPGKKGFPGCGECFLLKCA